MDVAEIFAALDAHIVKGLMMHAQMADYYDFLNLHGYKRLHEYRFFCESAEMRGLHRYYVNHYGKLIPESDVENPHVIPSGWYAYRRSDVSPEEKKRFIRDAFAKWESWEAETKALYQKSYSELCDIGEIAAACKVREMVSDVDQELKCVSRMRLNLAMIDYDLPTVHLCQDELHEKYAEKEKHIGVNIC
nr:MAG TPA: hypothetical protein [Caudoviricetes sp.]